MKTLLVLAPHPELAESLRNGLSPEQYRIVHRTTVEEAEPLLAHGLANACIVDVELSSVQGIWILEKLRRRSPKCALIIYTGAKQWEWEEEAYLQGATHVLNKPVRPRMLNALLERLWPAQARSLPATAPVVFPQNARLTESSPALPSSSSQPLTVLRDFSAILTHSLNADAMLKEFLLLLREILSINRAAIFLRQPYSAFEGRSAQDEGRRLRAACAVGLSPALLEHL